MRDALARIGRFEEPPVESIVPAVEPLRYRNKLEYSSARTTAASWCSASTARAAST